MTTGVRRARAALIGLMLVALVSCRLANQGSPSNLPSQSPASESPGESAAASPIPIDPTPSPTPVLPTHAGWQVIPLAIDGYVKSVAESDRGWVAVGLLEGGETAAIWFSDDGRSWRQVEDVPRRVGGVDDVISGGPGFMTFGTNRFIDWGEPYAWTSVDGLHWTAASFGDGVQLGTVQGVAELDGRFIAAGGLIGEPGFGPAVVWSSSDASAWTQTELDANGAAGAWALAPLEFAGQSVMLGSAYTPRMGRVWTSADGTTWQVQPDDPVLKGAVIYDFAVIGNRLVAVGSLWETDSTWRPAIWDSVDGRTWSLNYVGLCCDEILKIAPSHGTAFAFAARAVYQSEDGGAWELAGTIDGFHGNVVNVIDTRTYGQVAVGQGPDFSVLLVPPAQ